MEKMREGGFLISKVKQISGRIFDKKLKAAGIGDLNSAQGRIIFSLWQRDGVPITELARDTALGKTTLTGMLGRLEQGGHIEICPDEADRRRSIVCLTPKSLALKDAYAAVSREMLELFYAGLAEGEIDTFEDTLRRVLRNLMEYEEGKK